uniref:Uncharacterized protein n=1 Tax=Meloidogyne enterolobii TaxID=390850 RepID=A0A6V7WE37_MELEN|nr:unnamed protein product [Meloidogyne enterolobii]
MHFNCNSTIFDLFLNISTIEESCIKALEYSIDDVPCRLNTTERECCQEITTSVVKSVEPFCHNLAVSAFNFAKSLCKIPKNIAIASTKEGCASALAEIASHTQKSCYKSLGIPFSDKLALI